MHLETMLWLTQHFFLDYGLLFLNDNRPNILEKCTCIIGKIFKCSSCNRIDVYIVISKEDIFAFYQQLITLSESISSCSYTENILKHTISKERIIFKKMHIS